MKSIRISPALAVTIILVVALGATIYQDVSCEKTNLYPYVSTCVDSIGKMVFPNALSYFDALDSTVALVIANILCLILVWMVPWFRKPSLSRTMYVIGAYVLLSFAMTYLIFYIVLA